MPTHTTVLTCVCGYVCAGTADKKPGVLILILCVNQIPYLYIFTSKEWGLFKKTSI